MRMKKVQIDISLKTLQIDSFKVKKYANFQKGKKKGNSIRIRVTKKIRGDKIE